jgi:hypothetical protein
LMISPVPFLMSLMISPVPFLISPVPLMSSKE